jgi:queuine tRNA-ribosyltransferase
LGTDMFDCVMPTRNARNGMLFTTEGIINIRNKKWEDDFSPIDVGLGGYVSTFYSKAYLKHLMKCQEMLGAQIASVHNLRFYLWLVGEARKHILAGDFATWKPVAIKKLMQRL